MSDNKSNNRNKNIIEKIRNYDFKKAKEKTVTFLKLKKTIFILFFVYLISLLLMAGFWPVFYIFCFIPSLIALFTYKKMAKINAKFLKNINDTTLYLFASCKAFTFAANDVGSEKVKSIANFFETGNIAIIIWIIILSCTFLKTIIHGIESYRSISDTEQPKQ